MVDSHVKHCVIEKLASIFILLRRSRNPTSNQISQQPASQRIEHREGIENQMKQNNYLSLCRSVLTCAYTMSIQYNTAFRNFSTNKVTSGMTNVNNWMTDGIQ